MFIQANISNFITLIVAVILIIFFPSLEFPFILIFILCYIDIAIFKIIFEYQRITLLISRIAISKGSELLIPELQMLMTNSFVGFMLFLKSFLTGFIFGYLFLNSISLLVLFIVFQYVLNSLIPGYIPYDQLFNLIDLELNKKSIINPKLFMEKLRLSGYMIEIPHSSKYEKWAFEKYGNQLISVSNNRQKK